jgi:hypothetical protein
LFGATTSRAVLRASTMLVVALAVVAAVLDDAPIGLWPVAVLMVPTVSFRLGLRRVAVRSRAIDPYLVSAGMVYAGALVVATSVSKVTVL